MQRFSVTQCHLYYSDVTECFLQAEVLQVEQSVSLHDEMYKIMHSFKVNLQKSTNEKFFGHK